MVDDSSEYNDLEEVSASEILAKIERGEPVEYDHVIIVEIWTKITLICQ
jgi:hypothetical protein